MTELPTHKAYTSSDKTIHLWATGAIADYSMYAMFALIPAFFTTSFGLDPRLVGWALLIPRLFDAVADPIIGHISDITHTRWGRRRPFMFVAGLAGACVVVGLWWMGEGWPSWLQFTFLLIMSTLLFLCWGTYTMNHQALGYELSDDYHLRTKVMAVRNAWFAAAVAAGSWCYWLTERKVFGGEINGIRVISLVIASVAVISVLTSVFFSKERFQRANRQHVNIWQAIWATLNVKPYLVLIAIRVIQTLGGSLYGAVAFYITTYSVCGNDKEMTNFMAGIGGVAGLCISLLMVPLAVKMSRFVGKRRGLIIGVGMAFVSACLIPVFARPGMPYLLLAHTIIFGVCFGTILNIFQSAVMPDICDIDELKSGERREALFAAVNSFVSKVENSLCALLGGYVLWFAGFNADFAKQNHPQLPEVVERMRWLGFTPVIAFSGLAFLVVWLYPVTEKMMTEVRAQLEARRASGLAQEGLAEPAA